jgi:thioredoxin reductase (NADPH)
VPCRVVAVSCPDVPEATGLSVDLLIVGAGPVGLYGAYYAGFRSLSVAVMDSLPEPGGQVTALYPEKLIYDVAGFPAVQGRELVASLVEQAARWEPAYLLGHRAETLEAADGGRLVVVTDTGGRVAARAIVITGGMGVFSPRPLPVGSEWLGRGVAYFVPRPEDHRGHDVVVVGGGDAAFDTVAALQPLAASVRLVHRREDFRAQPATVERVRSMVGVELLTSSEVAAIRGGDAVEEVDVRHRVTGGTRTLKAQTVIAALGFLANLGPLRTWGLALRGNRTIAVDTTMATNLPGVFAAGDVVDYPGKVRLLGVGFGEVATAVNNAAVFIDPAAHLFPGHSSADPNGGVTAPT